MRILYLDCGMGAAGDMLTAALLGLLPDEESFVREFNALGIPRVSMKLEKGSTCGISGTKVRIFVDDVEEHSHDHKRDEKAETHEHCHEHSHTHGEHSHMGRHEVEHIICHLPLSEKVRNNALAVYSSIADAESKVHGVSVENVHFHELGSLDAVADVVAFSMLIDRLAPDRVISSPVHVGFGHVHCAHGILPVPAPATAQLLIGIPFYSGEIEGELCTPTGAALLRQFVDEYGTLPVMRVKAIGYGVGSKVFPKANCIRAMIGESEAGEKSVCELSCNLDDMTGEAIGFAIETLLSAGALDVYTIPIGMKKSRPGVMLCCLCAMKDREEFADLMLKHTTSLGVRIAEMSRITADRQEKTVETPLGEVSIKCAKGDFKVEYEDVSQIAKKNGLTFRETEKLIKEHLYKKQGD